MGVGTFSVGQRFDLDGTRHHITRLLGDGRIEFEDKTTARRQEQLLDDMLKAFKQGRLVFRAVAPPSSEQQARTRVVSQALLAAASPAQRDIAALRLHFVTKLKGVTTTRTTFIPLVRSIWEALKKPERELMPVCPAASTVTRWLQQYRDADGNINALLDRHALKGNRTSRLEPDVEQLIDDCIQDLYLTPERRNIRTVTAAVNDHINRSNLERIASEFLPHVSYGCVKAKIAELSSFDVYAARYGKRAAEVKFRSTGLGPVAELPLDRASMDHCLLDLLVIDEVSGLPLARPWLTIILDECTRMILGYSVTFDEPSAMSSMRAYRHASLPKDECSDVINSWPTWGVIRTLVVDNGLEFHGHSLDHAAGLLGTTVQTCPRRKPWFKGKVERFFRTVQADLIAEIPGRTFSNVLDRGEYDSSKHAVISLRTLNRVLNMWIVDYYHQRRHSGLAESPARKWARLIDQVDRQLPDSAQWLDAAFGKPDERILGHQGIQFDSLFYNSPEMAALRHRHGDRVGVGIVTNDEDIGYLYVLCPDTQQYLKVPAVDASYASGMTRWQHRKCRAYANALSEQYGRDVSLGDAKQRIRELIRADMKLTTRHTRRKQARFLDLPLAPPSMEPPPAVPAAVNSSPASAPPPMSLQAEPPVPIQLAPEVFSDELLDLTASPAHQFSQEMPA